MRRLTRGAVLACVLVLAGASQAMSAPERWTLNYARVGAYEVAQQWMCENTNGSPCIGASPLLTTNWTVDFSAESSAEFGLLRARSSVFLRGDGANGSPTTFTSVGGNANYRDVVTILGGTGDGVLHSTFRVTGRSTETTGQSGRAQFGRTLFGPNGEWIETGYSPDSDGLVTVPIPFKFGEPVEFQIRFYALAQLWTYVAGASATADFFATARLVGIDVRDAAGLPSQAYSVSAASGTDYQEVARRGAKQPFNLRVERVSGNVVTLRWGGPASAPDPVSYIVEGGLHPGAPIVTIPVGSGAVTTLTVPNGTYYARVRSVVSGETSEPSNEVPLFVNVARPPSPPTSFTTLVRGSSVDLSYRLTSDAGTPQSVLLEVSGAATAAIELPPDELHSFAGVPAGTYTVGLRSTNAHGVSDPVLRTLVVPGANCPGPPSAPLNLLVSREGARVSILWDPPETGRAPTSYALNVSGTLQGTLPTTARRVEAVAPSGTYHVSVVAVNACGSSAPSTTRVINVP